MNLKHLIFLLSLIASVTVYGQSKTFVRDYTYRASDADSKITSRQKALKEVKAFLIEELGTYVQSYVNYEVEELNGKMTKDFFTNEIKTFSAGMVETKIIEEEWDGYNYYVQAEITADPEEVIRRINETLSVRKKSLVVDSLKVLLKYADVELNNQASELEELENKLESANGQLHSQIVSYSEANNELESLRAQLAGYQKEEQEVKVELLNQTNQLEELEEKLNSKNSQLNSQVASYKKAKIELDSLKIRLAKYQMEEQEVRDEIEAIRQNVLSKGSKARDFVRIGMSEGEVATYFGQSSSSSRYLIKWRSEAKVPYLQEIGNGRGIMSNTTFYAIGDVWIHFSEDTGLVDGLWEHDKILLIIDTSNLTEKESLLKKYNIGEKLY
jgi:chromosome segregation ATPase